MRTGIQSILDGTGAFKVTPEYMAEIFMDVSFTVMERQLAKYRLGWRHTAVFGTCVLVLFDICLPYMYI